MRRNNHRYKQFKKFKHKKQNADQNSNKSKDRGARNSNLDGNNGKNNITADSPVPSSRRRIYTLNGLPPEVVAVAFAKTSRSPDAFDKIASELNADKSRKFHEKWIVGYGHSSVAEHAVLSIAIENVSILATKVLEDNRLASYTEKSTRYQVFDKTRYYKPPNLMRSALGKVYEENIDRVMDIYTDLVMKMTEFLKKKYPKEEGQGPKMYETIIKNKALDNIRYMLPIAVLTNLGMTVNARSLEYAIVKLLSHPLEEMRRIGREIKEAALKVTPTLIKYTDCNECIVKTNEDFQKIAAKHLKCAVVPPHNGNEVVLVEYDKDAEDKIVASLLYRFSNVPYNTVLEKVSKMNYKEKEKIIESAHCRMSRHDKPMRELEHANYTFDILIDYGAFRDIQRHRIATQVNQAVTVDYGYEIPPEIVEAGLERPYAKCMELAKETYHKIAADFPEEAAYAVPLGFRKRVLMTMNLRELHHFIKLRSGAMGHASYRKVAQQMYDLLMEKQPLLAKYINVKKD